MSEPSVYGMLPISDSLIWQLENEGEINELQICDKEWESIISESVNNNNNDDTHKQPIPSDRWPCDNDGRIRRMKKIFCSALYNGYDASIA